MYDKCYICIYRSMYIFLYYTVLQNIILYYTILYSIVLCDTLLHDIIVYYTILHYIVLYYKSIHCPMVWAWAITTLFSAASILSLNSDHN